MCWTEGGRTPSLSPTKKEKREIWGKREAVWKTTSCAVRSFSTLEEGCNASVGEGSRKINARDCCSGRSFSNQPFEEQETDPHCTSEGRDKDYRFAGKIPLIQGRRDLRKKSWRANITVHWGENFFGGPSKAGGKKVETLQ